MSHASKTRTYILVLAIFARTTNKSTTQKQHKSNNFNSCNRHRTSLTRTKKLVAASSNLITNCRFLRRGSNGPMTAMLYSMLLLASLGCVSAFRPRQSVARVTTKFSSVGSLKLSSSDAELAKLQDSLFASLNADLGLKVTGNAVHSLT